MAKKTSKERKGFKKQRRKPVNRTTGILCGFVACCIGIYFHFRDGTLTVETDFAKRISFNVTCSTDYKKLTRFDGCSPVTLCGRVVRDNVIKPEEANRLKEIAERGLAHGGSNGGASILDLHSGALSMGEQFVNIFKYVDKEALKKTFSHDDFSFYSRIKSRVHETIAEEFGVDSQKLYLTHPTFFSKITNISAKTAHDEYWHEHIDKIQYGSFDYTSLVYLTDYEKDFTGGRFIFDGENGLTIEPRKGRLSFFTSGSENPHHVEKVLSGTRYAITISFTCDPEKAIKDPKLQV